MDRRPGMASRAERQAATRCRAEQQRLAEHNEDLDKLAYAEQRYLYTNRHRFLLDRRQSLAAMFDPATPSSSHPRHPARRGSDPEVIQIFRRHEDRRRSLRATEEALSRDLVRRLESKYQRAMRSNGSDADAEDSGSDCDVMPADGFNRAKLSIRPDGDQTGGATSNTARDRGSDNTAENEDTHHPSLPSVPPAPRVSPSSQQEQAVGTAHNSTSSPQLATPGFVRSPANHQNHGKLTRDLSATTDRDTGAETHRKASAACLDRKDGPAEESQVVNEENEAVDAANDSGSSAEMDSLQTADRLEEVTFTVGCMEEDTNQNTTDVAVVTACDKHTDSHQTSAYGRSPRNTSTHPQANNTELTVEKDLKGCGSALHKGLNKELDKEVNKEENKEANKEVNKDANDSSTVNTLQVPGQTAESGDDGGERKAKPRRKRSYSDGNIFFNIYDVMTDGSQAYLVPKATGQEAASTAGGGSDAVADTPKPGGGLPRQGWVESKGGDSMGIWRDETYVIEDLPHTSPSPTRRRFVEVTLTLPDADQTLSPRMTRRHGNTMVRSTSTSDVTAMQRRKGNVTPVDIKLSPSLKRRLAGPEGGGRVEEEGNTADVRYSPSLTRRIAEASRTNSRMTPRQPDPAGSPRLQRYDPETKTSPRLTRNDPDPKTSPRLARKDDKSKGSKARAKPTSQQPTDCSKKTAPKRRPLRRSRSEVNFDNTALTNGTTRVELADVPRSTRRGSEGVTSESVRWDGLMYGLALNQEEREEISRHKRMQLVTSLRKRQQEVDSDVSRRIRTFLSRYDDA